MIKRPNASSSKTSLKLQFCFPTKKWADVIVPRVTVFVSEPLSHEGKSSLKGRREHSGS